MTQIFLKSPETLCHPSFRKGSINKLLTDSVHQRAIGTSNCVVTRKLSIFNSSDQSSPVQSNKHMGTKRSWDGNPVDADVEMAEVHTSPGSTDKIQSLFMTFRTELDEHHDRRERVIKASRDITALSKKIIFSLQRVRTLKAPLPKNIAKENSERFTQIRTLFSTIANDISTGPNAWRYHHQFSFGLQEYIEALSFQHYIEHHRLIPHEDVVRSLPEGILVTDSDYVLGLFDLTGEMMRFAITSMTSKGLTPGGKIESLVTGTTDGPSDEKTERTPHEQGETIVDDLRALRAMFESLNVPRRHQMSRELPQKMDTMQASVEKVERAAYGLQVRGSERPTGWVPDLSSAAPVESY